jgi:hypothetical protein
VVYTNFSAPIAGGNTRGKLAGHSTNIIKNITVISKMETTDHILQNIYWRIITLQVPLKYHGSVSCDQKGRIHKHTGKIP